MQKRLSGQVGLMLLVVLGLVISVVLSIAAKSLSDVVLSRQEKENNTTFALAESGVEKALQAISSGSLPSGEVEFNDESELITGVYSVAEEQGLDLYVKVGEQAELDLTGFSGNKTIRWTKKTDLSENPATCSEGDGKAPAAIEIVRIMTDQSVARSYYNSFSCSALGNGFDASIVGTGGFLSRANYAVPKDTKYLRIRPYYSGATINVDGVGATQMYLVKSGAEGGDADKEIEVKRSRDSSESVFDYALFSGINISHN